MGSGKAEENRQRAITEQQLADSRWAMEKSREDDASRRKLMQPAIDRYSAITSGDRGTINSTLAPELNAISRSYAGAKDKIYDAIPSGPARDVAVADAYREQAGKTADLKSSIFMSSFDKLANIGAGLGSFSLNEFGAGLRGGEAASSSNMNLLKAENDRRAATLAFLGGLAQTAGSVVGGKPWK